MGRPEFHKSTLFVGFISTAVMAVIVFPGELVSPTGGNFGGGYTAEYAHGWPWTYLNRSLHYDFHTGGKAFPDLPIAGVPWLSWDSWQVWECNDDFAKAGRNRLRLVAFIGDFVVWGAIPSFAIAACELIVRRKRNWRQFRVFDLLLAMTIICIVAGWAMRRIQLRDRELRSIERFHDSPHLFYERSTAPDSLRRLVGYQLLPDFTLTVDAILFSDPDSKELTALVNAAKDFPGLRTVEISNADPPSRLPLRLLKNLPQIRLLALHCNVDEAVACELASLQQLNRLILWGDDDIPDDVMRALRASLPGCEILREWPDEN